MKNYHEDNARWGQLLATARRDAGYTQEEAAKLMSAGTRTIQNWEYGISSPNVPQSIDYLNNSLKVNARKYFHLYLNPNYSGYDNITLEELELRQHLARIVMYSMQIKDVEEMIYLYEGEHGSDPHAVMQLMTANIESPMESRFRNALSVVLNYEYEKQKGNVADKAPQVDIDALVNATEAGKRAALDNRKSYV